MGALEAVLKVLQEAGTPLHYREITKRILARKLWSAAGETPAATVNARLTVDMKKLGKTSAFRRVGRGMYGLNTQRTDPAAAVGAVKAEEPALYVTGVRAGQTLSFTEAAERILESAGGKPMHYRDITRHALEFRMLDTSGKTPAGTMYAQILTEVKRRQGRGEQQRFMILGKGMMALARWQAKGLAFQVEEANRKARKELLKLIKEMGPGGFSRT